MKTEADEKKLKAMLKDPEHQSNFDLLRQHGKENQSKWEHEIAMLERRVKEETAKIDLGNGDKLEIRSCLSDAEMEEFGNQQGLITKLNKSNQELAAIWVIAKKENREPNDEELKRIQRLEESIKKNEGPVGEATYKLLALATSNPLLTVEWFKQNRDRYATSDMSAVLIGFYEDRVQRQKSGIDRVKSAADFRTN